MGGGPLFEALIGAAPGETRHMKRKKDRTDRTNPSDNQTFHGATFVWNTPNDGPKTIGVIATASGQHYVGWWAQDHVGVRLATHRLPVSADADVLQVMLEDYAEKRGLEAVLHV